MRIIYKYPIEQVAEMPMGFKVLRVGMQNGTPCLWAEVPMQGPLIRTRFKIYGTGQEISDGASYIGGFSEGPFEWHVYEVPA